MRWNCHELTFAGHHIVRTFSSRGGGLGEARWGGLEFGLGFFRLSTTRQNIVAYLDFFKPLFFKGLRNVSYYARLHTSEATCRETSG